MPEKVPTVTVTVFKPLGATAVSVNGLVTLTVVAADEPKETLEAEVNPVPWTVTVVPPRSGPVAGDSEVTVGGCLMATLVGALRPLVGP